MLLRARHFATARPIAVTLQDGQVMAVVNADDAPDGWIAPAFFDIQINGGRGVGFTSPTLAPEQVRFVADLAREHGVGGFCPTVITSGFDTLAHALRTLRTAVEQDRELAERLPAFHLEGPYICPDDGPRGAHPRRHVRNPDWDEFSRLQDASGGRIRLVTLAPEWPGAIPFIERLTTVGVVVSIGHTAATGGQIADAVRAGAKLSTHLGNGCHAMLPRHENYLWEQLAIDDLTASVIADGHHLSPAVLKCILRVKTPKRVILTSDAGTFAGSPPGRYSDWGSELEVMPGGKIVLPGTPFLAGSGVFSDTCVSGVMTLGGVSLTDAISMASVRPRTLLGLPVPSVSTGSHGPFVLFDWQPGEGVKVRRVVG